MLAANSLVNVARTPVSVVARRICFFDGDASLTERH
jgi:hypothetical protein